MFGRLQESDWRVRVELVKKLLQTIKLGSTDQIIIQEWLVWTIVLAWSRSQSIFGW